MQFDIVRLTIIRQILSKQTKRTITYNEMNNRSSFKILMTQINSVVNFSKRTFSGTEEKKNETDLEAWNSQNIFPVACLLFLREKNAKKSFQNYIRTRKLPNIPGGPLRMWKSPFIPSLSTLNTKSKDYTILIYRELRVDEIQTLFKWLRSYRIKQAGIITSCCKCVELSSCRRCFSN